MKVRLAVPAVATALAVGLGGLALAPAALASGTHAQAPSSSAEAPAFDASGTWGITQSNGLHPTVVVSQDAQGQLTGTASVGSTTGTFEQGFVDGTYIEFVIDWSNGSKGRYIGDLGSDRRLSGVGTDLAHPGSQATWVSNRTF
ncbi:hypothetical protein ABT390_06010 [Streptomyces aurantiacus]|uniref:Uncharacterized protein n=1 Tax=Streptomyces aurantiacus JA 4570 TaxID=1286094 RepID=S4AK48_9ACTN|nr:hypothetical protein [Streptomyces aurantiacus]EPH41852.1 hypothetical protein STRAU_5114 [Streptomyces aurantiacus JA 4570]